MTGSNRGDRAGLLEEARRRIGLRVGAVTQASAVYESEPWGFSDDRLFLNQALAVETELEPTAVLDAVQAIERELGRRRETTPESGGERVYESRPIDIDILFYDDLILRTERLTIPHPLIREREFVLAPLREIMPDYLHPVYRKPVREL